ncbi:MAG: beta-propeller domain-containing protein [Burkholderiales bacterium]
MIAAVLVLAACSSGRTSTPPPATANNKLEVVSKPGEFVAQVKTLLNKRRAAGVTSNDVIMTTGMPVPAGVPAPSSVSVPAYSSTIRQEAAVDEDDLVKTNGLTIYSFSGMLSGADAPTLQAHQRNIDGSLTEIGSIKLGGTSSYQSPHGLLLTPDSKRLLSLRSQDNYSAPSCPAGALCPAYVMVDRNIGLDLFNTNSNGSLGSSVQVEIQGYLIAGRMIGNFAILVSSHYPRLQAELMQTQEQRDAAFNNLTAAEILPNVRINGGAPQPLMADTQCFTQVANTSNDITITTITAIDLSAPGFSQSSRCFLGGTEAVYVAPNNVYLSTSRYPQIKYDQQLARWIYPDASEFRTDIHKFAIDGNAVSYRASGDVAGHLGWSRERNSYHLSEYNNDLRVVTFTGITGWGSLDDASNPKAPPPSPATLSILRETDGKLDAVATLPNARHPEPIGLPNEQVYAVRFMGDRGYVVTFRRTDPLYILDLHNPADPLQAGEIKASGFSDYLFPMANGLLLGVGKEADVSGMVQGVKVSLFDVKSASQPRIMDSLTFGGRGSNSALDYSSHGISMMSFGNTKRIALPLQLTEVGSQNFQTAAHYLQKLEVNEQAGTLRMLDNVSAPAGSFDSLYHERALHIEEQVYYYANGGFNYANW